MPDITTAYQWGINTCNAPNVGYSQQYRNQRTVNGITYYDCSSFIWYALIAGGWDMEGQFGTWPFTTYTMANILTQLGFTRHSPDDAWLPGDILLRTEHTEMAFDGTRTMGAHTSRVPLAEQVSINANDSRGGWLSLWRWENGANVEWIKGNVYLEIGQMQNNARLVWYYMQQWGWSINACAALLGNMQGESTINPGLYESFVISPSVGYGLVQWTPGSIIQDWLTQNGYEIDNGYGQLVWIDTETVPQGQWIETSTYPMSLNEFKTSTEDVATLAYVFMYNFERPASLDHPERQTYAEYWLRWLQNEYVPPTNPPMNGGQQSRRSWPWWLYQRRLL